MRQIHPTQFHEQFVASGVYTFYTDDTPTGVIQQWSIYQQPDGSQVLRVDHQGEKREQVTLVEAWRSAGGMIERFDIQAFSDAATPYRQVRAQYVLEGTSLRVTRLFDDAATHYAEVDLPEGIVLHPLPGLLTGLLAAEMLGSDTQPITVVSPVIAFTDEILDAGISLSHDSLVLMGNAVLSAAGQAVATRRYQYYSEDHLQFDLWLDRRSIPVKIADAHLSTLLTQAAHRPEANTP
jgi:hypothetical protein